MTAKIVVLANQKGGCGKTMLSMQLAGAWARDRRVLVVDADPQATATRWAAAASDDSPFPATVVGLAAAGGKLHREIGRLAQDYDFVVVDCPPAVESVAPQSALLVADMALMPVIPAPADYWATHSTQGLIEQVAAINEALRARLIPNMVPHTNLGTEVLAALEEATIPCTDTRIGSRTIYREAQAFGTTVYAMGFRARAAIEEITILANEIDELLTTERSLEAHHG
jgi:chromosome partitioning protein